MGNVGRKKSEIDWQRATLTTFQIGVKTLLPFNAQIPVQGFFNNV
jgi:hypothetical protein